MSILHTISSDWYPLVSDFLSSSKGEELELNLESLDWNITYPAKDSIFYAFSLFPPSKTKVVILGQDPYHGEGQAHGLSFSVQKGIKLPPSLRNIYKERENDLGLAQNEHGDLSSWAKQGVLLLNTVLTVEKGKAASHQKMGWVGLTDALIKNLSERESGIVFILWGAPAQKKEKLIDLNKHKILKSPHPSPLSSYRGFFGSKPFSKANKYLESIGKKPIKW